MEWFRDDGCLTDEGLRALTAGQLDELGRLETAEHLSYCDACMDRYTALLTADALETPPRSMRGTVMSTIWVRLMQNTYGRVAVASVAAVLALSMWKAGTLGRITRLGSELNTILPPAQSQDAEPERRSRNRSASRWKRGADRESAAKAPRTHCKKLLDGVTNSPPHDPQNYLRNEGSPLYEKRTEF